MPEEEHCFCEARDRRTFGEDTTDLGIASCFGLHVVLLIDTAVEVHCRIFPCKPPTGNRIELELPLFFGRAFGEFERGVS